MKILKCIVFLGLIVMSCTHHKKIEKPKNLISKEKMVNVLIDLSLLSSAKGVNKKILENNGVDPDAYVYNRHHIDSVQFAQSNAYYSYHVDDYKDILKQVEDSLNRLKSHYNRLDEKANKLKLSDKENKSKTIAKKKRDSLIEAPNIDE